MTSFQLATQEMTGTRALQEEHTAHHAAEAAVEMVMEWFHDPAAAHKVLRRGYLQNSW